MTTDRRLQALELRKQGKNFEEIAAALGITKSAAWQLVDGALRDYNNAVKESVDELRQVTLLQLDDMLANWLPIARAGDDKAAGIVLKTLGERAKLMGLYAPTKTELTGKDGGPLETANLNAAVDLAKLSDAQLAALESLLSAAAPGSGTGGSTP
ncbi:hypothetical protein C1702_11145 [Caldimonas thermodepolymerans]|uniref:Uncharacterized protein n=1 Tax=Caldimonas thermodepolymerans TaxID=215580 RepID=A0A2S5T3B9_9BURK|nr:hypothetical protein C1702_11145 [Caldimonas thermodepolymerans]